MKGSDLLPPILHQRGLEIGLIHSHALTKALRRRNARNVQESRHAPVSAPRYPLDQLMIRLDDIVSRWLRAIQLPEAEGVHERDGGALGLNSQVAPRASRLRFT